ncbi:MAG TPA: glutathione S-transferase N-terminal domain-containing protein [Methylomirabilota bacterium]|nr:glutathione S-transferase N-terminal domain-containing protein [Methylomirabilota bacterium]
MTAQTLPIDLYFWPTPNGFKISIMLEELGVPYSVHFVRIGKGDQFKPEFLAISPNNKMPAIVDPEGPGGKPISVFESGAILLYLGRKFGRFYPTDERARVDVEQWLMWQMSGFGPMLGQNHHFSLYAPEKLPYAIRRYQDETHRLYGVLEKQLQGRDFITGEYTIADMATLGWARGWRRQGMEAGDFPNVMAWIDRMEARPAVARALRIKAPEAMNLADDKEAQKILFNQRAR